ncbi:MAG: hypothetical protein ABL885_00160 [Methylophilaceae bacterium]
MTEINLDSVFTDNTPHLQLLHAQRANVQYDGIVQIHDTFEGAECIFLRAYTTLGLRLNGQFALQKCASGGWLLQSRDPATFSYWLPAPATLRRVSTQGHILEERPAEPESFDLDISSVGIAFAAIPVGWTLDAVIWKLNDAVLIDELQTLAAIETQGYFLLGSHTRYEKPGDLYRHLVHGWVYEDRYSWPHKRRICSENDAHALHLVLSGLKNITGKRIYGLLKTQLLLSVLSRQSEDGAFRHGEWTEGMESHYRLHCSAMHLLMDALSEANDRSVKAALAQGMRFIASKYDNTAMGAWFYHDELETTEAGMRGAPFKWWPGVALGKSVQNMLVLNTQLDTLVALDRYGVLTGDTQYLSLVNSGFQALNAVLNLRPMEWLYRLIFSAIDLTLLPTEKAVQLPVWKRLWKRIGWQVFIPYLPRLKTRFPRLVMPGGYIDRELSLQTWAFDYLAVNLMDLVRAAQGEHQAAFKPYIDGILNCCVRTDIALRWLEQKGRTYSVGFYAEALYLLSLHESRQELDAMLSDALVLCVRHQLGLPPSVLGGNAEAQATHYQFPQSSLAHIVVVNLSTIERKTCLVVNAGQHAVKIKEVLCAIPSGWSVPEAELASGAHLRINA